MRQVVDLLILMKGGLVVSSAKEVPKAHSSRKPVRKQTVTAKPSVTVMCCQTSAEDTKV